MTARMRADLARAASCGTIHQRSGIRIRTHFVYPPIPDRRFDWSAVDDDSYDGAPDSSTRNQIAYGRTEEEAIECFLEMVCSAPESNP